MEEKSIKKWTHQRMLNDLMCYWNCCLSSNGAANTYLRKRGVSEEIAAKFKIGYVDIKRPVRKSLFTMDDPEANKIFKELGFLRDDGKDKFFDRIMLPFHDVEDRVIGFTGRMLKDVDKVAKYLRTKFPEQLPRGETAPMCWANCRDAVEKSKEIILVEGPFDALAMQSAGYLNTVAMQGTSNLTKMAWFYSDMINRGITIKFLFDRDSAGEKAKWEAVRDLTPLLNDEFGPDYMIFPSLPTGISDPCDLLVKKDGVDQMQEVMRTALTLEGELLRRLPINKNSIENLANNANRIKMVLQNFEVETNTYKLMKDVLERQTRVKVQPRRPEARER